MVGDDRRFVALADYIVRNYKPCRVADVAGGTGQLSYHLALHGFDCTVIDPRKTDLPKSMRSDARRKRLHIQRAKRPFRREDAKHYALLVGLHCDDATEELCHAATGGKAVIVVPCCHFWKGIESHGSPNMGDTVRRCWKRMGVPWRELLLPIHGKNLMLEARRAVQNR